MAVDRLLHHELAAHRPPLLTHPRANEYGSRRLSRLTAARAVGAFFSLQKRLELLHQLRLVMGNERQPELMMGSLHACRKADVAQCRVLQAALFLEGVKVRSRQ